MPSTSPPRQRHDGTSPLPLGMDWSPRPKKWEGRNTVWPHNPKTSWSYCVMIPSWIVQAGVSSDNFLNPIVFYRIQVGILSPQGVSTTHGVLRRFNDFLKLFSAVKKAFPKKDIPPAPPKHALLRINSSRQLLEERRRALVEWMGKLLSDIDLSRSAPVASFIELEAAARSSFQDASEHSLETSMSGNALSMKCIVPRQSSSGVSVECSTIASKSQSATSYASNDITCESSDAGTLRQQNTKGDINNDDVIMHEMLDQPVDFPKHSSQEIKYNNGVGGGASSRNSSKEVFLLRNKFDSASERAHGWDSSHSSRLSNESFGSDACSTRCSVLPIPGVPSLVSDAPVYFSSSIEFPSITESLSNTDTQFLNDAHILIPLDERHKINRVLITMQRRLAAAKTDMEDLIAQLNQEITVKEYLISMVKDFEVDLSVTKQSSKENLQQAISLESEGFTQTQWDMEELRRKYMVMESKLKFQQSEKTRVISESTTNEKEISEQELATKQEQMDNLQRHLEELGKKSKADIKALVKEIKFLRNSLSELKEMIYHSTKYNTDLEGVIQNKKQMWAHVKSVRKNLLCEYENLRQRLQECSANFLDEMGDRFTISLSSFPDALGLLATSDSRIGLLIAEAQSLAQDDEEAVSNLGRSETLESSGDVLAVIGDDPITGEEEMRRMLIGTLIDNARLRKQLNSAFRCALKIDGKQENE